MTPFNKAFNVAVKHMADRVLPRGYDVGADAPSTLEGLKAHYNKIGRILVDSGNSDCTIFADAEVNYAFRAWHDSIHLMYGFPFTLEGEQDVCRIQQAQIKVVYGRTPDAFRFCQLIECEVVGQAVHFEMTGSYLDDQRAFARGYLEANRSDLTKT